MLNFNVDAPLRYNVPAIVELAMDVFDETNLRLDPDLARVTLTHVLWEIAKQDLTPTREVMENTSWVNLLWIGEYSYHAWPEGADGRVGEIAQLRDELKAAQLGEKLKARCEGIIATQAIWGDVKELVADLCHLVEETYDHDEDGKRLNLPGNMSGADCIERVCGLENLVFRLAKALGLGITPAPDAEDDFFA